MAIEKRNILHVHRRLAKLTDDEVTRVLKSLRLSQQGYNRRIARLITSLDIPDEGLNPAFVASQIQRKLNASGIINVNVGTTQDRMDALFRAVEANPFQGKPLASSIAAELREIRDANIIRTRNFMRRHPERLQQLTKQEWVEFLKDKGKNVANHVETLVRTELHGAMTDRTVALAEEAEVEYYRYDGVLSANSRTFCRKHKGKVYHIETIQQLDNGMLNPVITYRGGYNCVHRWTPLPFYNQQRAA